MSLAHPQDDDRYEDEEEVQIQSNSCMHCRARSYSSSIMEAATMMSTSSSSSSSNGHHAHSTPEDTGYFSFGSIGLMEPKEEQVERAKYSKEYQHKSARSPTTTTTTMQHVKRKSKTAARPSRNRSQSLSRIMTFIIGDIPRTRPGHPLSRSVSASMSISKQRTPPIFENPPPSVSPQQLSPLKRPSLMNTVRVKSDPCIVKLDKSRCENRYSYRTVKTCEMGFIVNAETSLRDVL